MSASVHDAFLRMIREDPDNDVPRLAYADWLDECGDPRGEFIRVQCELARLTGEDPQHYRLRKREATLLGRHKAEWTGAARALVKSFRLRRGFVDEVTLTFRQFRERGPALWELAPIRQIKVKNLTDAEVAGLADEGRWPAVSGVTLYYGFREPPAGGLLRFLQPPRARRLTRLGVGGGTLTQRHVQAVARLTGLKELTLQHQCGPGRRSSIRSVPSAAWWNWSGSTSRTSGSPSTGCGRWPRAV